jgi:hypothetical protein
VLAYPISFEWAKCALQFVGFDNSLHNHPRKHICVYGSFNWENHDREESMILMLIAKISHVQVGVLFTRVLGTKHVYRSSMGRGMVELNARFDIR